MLHTTIWENADFAKLSDKAKILYIGTITLADDDGRLKANSLILRSKIFMLDPLVTIEDVRKYTNEIVRVKLVSHYKVNDEHFIEHPNWKKFQTLRKDLYKPSSIPTVTDASRSRDEDVTETYPKLSKGSKDKYARKKRAGSPKKQKFQDTTPMSLQEYVNWMKSSPERHVQIVGEWAEAEGPNFTTKGQWESFTSRNVRVAQTLMPYSTSQIEKAYHAMLEDVEHTDKRTGKKVGFIKKYTLETLTKYIDQI